MNEVNHYILWGADIPKILNPSSGYLFNTNNSPFNATRKDLNLLEENYNKSFTNDDLKNVQNFGEAIHSHHFILSSGKGTNQDLTRERYLKRKMDIGNIHLFSHKYCQI